MKPNYKEIAKSVLSLFDNGEYTAALVRLVEELSYTDYLIDGDHGIKVISVKDIIAVCEQLKK